MASVDEAKQLIGDLCNAFYDQGWVSGTGGGMSIRTGEKIVMAPSGVPKERMAPTDMFVLDRQGEVLEAPEARLPPYKEPKLSECAPLFMSAYNLRDAGAVIHSHSLNAVMATMLVEGASEFHCTQLEMIKGIKGHGFFDDLVVPIIENTARECELTERLQAAMRAYPKSSAVLVRRHGVYVWGDTWLQAKTQAECYDYLFESAIKLRQLGIDTAIAPKATTQNGSLGNGLGKPSKQTKTATKPSAIVLDIEGTVAPITFVTEQLFPYAAQRLQSHLEDHFSEHTIQQAIALFRKQASEDGQPFPVGGTTPEIISAVVATARADMRADRKSAALKTLQGHIWHGGFQSGELVAQMYQDVLPALKQWTAAGIKVYIYSSGSRAAQRDLFGHTQEGDLRHHISAFFDTSSGIKIEEGSYRDLALSIGVDSPEEILFATDSLPEAEAAVAAGWQVALTVREGNKPLPSAGLPTDRLITTMADLLEC